MNAKQKWYFDSGSSKHMTGNKKLLSNLQPCGLESVTFNDGVKGTITGMGLLKVLGIPELENVLLVGLKVNLISISQLCDQNLFVRFTKNKCLVLDSTNLCVMEGKRSPYNCYLLTYSGMCFITALNNSNIWHRRLGHISHKSLSETLAADAVLLKLKIIHEKVCGPCQIGKQIRKSHKMVQHSSTTRVLQLLHMDLMGPMQVESLGGKK